MKSSEYSDFIFNQIKNGEPDIEEIYEASISYMNVGKRKQKNTKFQAGLFTSDDVLIEMTEPDGVYLNDMDKYFGDTDEEGKIIKRSGSRKIPGMVSKDSLRKNVFGIQLANSRIDRENNRNMCAYHGWVGPSAYFKWNKNGLKGVKPQIDAEVYAGLASFEIEEILGNEITLKPKSIIPCRKSYKKVFKVVRKHDYEIEDVYLFNDTYKKLNKRIKKG